MLRSLQTYLVILSLKRIHAQYSGWNLVPDMGSDFGNFSNSFHFEGMGESGEMGSHIAQDDLEYKCILKFPISALSASQVLELQVYTPPYLGVSS